MSFALAKDWLLKQQNVQSEVLQTGAINREAQEVIANLNSTLAEQAMSTAALLEQPPHPASPVVLSPVMSTGPDRVTDQERAEECAEVRERAEECAEVRALRKAEAPHTYISTS